MKDPCRICKYIVHCEGDTHEDIFKYYDDVDDYDFDGEIKAIIILGE